MDNPYKSGIDAATAKIAQENEREITIKLKGKHLKALRRLASARLMLLSHRPLPGDKPEEVSALREADQILFDAQQLL